MTPISFKASFVKNTQVQQTLSNNQTREKTVSIVELDRNNLHDRRRGRKRPRRRNIAENA